VLYLLWQHRYLTGRTKTVGFMQNTVAVVTLLVVLSVPAVKHSLDETDYSIKIMVSGNVMCYLCGWLPAF
jgi:hypothetical protein